MSENEFLFLSYIFQQVDFIEKSLFTACISYYNKFQFHFQQKRGDYYGK